MDTTRITELLSDLQAADPADAPDLADELTAVLADALDGPDSGPKESGASEPETTAP